MVPVGGKRAGFGNVFFSNSQQWHTTHMSILSLLMLSLNARFLPICHDLKALCQFRWCRVLHNLVAFAEAVQKLTEDGRARLRRAKQDFRAG